MTCLFPSRRALARLIVPYLAAFFVLTRPADLGAQPSPHIRVSDPDLRKRLTTGEQQSPTLRDLQAQLERAPILVFVECGTRMPTRVGARLSLVTTVNSVQYVHVEVDCWQSERQQIPLLAHELQHALEVASRPDIVDSDSFQTYYEGAGYLTLRDGGHVSYETDAALAVQRRVLAEIDSASSRR